MFLRDVLTRWNARPVDTALTDEGATPCRTRPSLLEELAADPADFADLAQVLRLDLTAVMATLVDAQPATVEELADRLRQKGALTGADVTAADLAKPAPATMPSRWSSWVGGEARGWGRWTRARGGARVHPEAERAPTAARAALAAR